MSQKTLTAFDDNATTSESPADDLRQPENAHFDRTQFEALDDYRAELRAI